jgi:hypothetical protein
MNDGFTTVVVDVAVSECKEGPTVGLVRGWKMNRGGYDTSRWDCDSLSGEGEGSASEEERDEESE